MGNYLKVEDLRFYWFENDGRTIYQLLESKILEFWLGYFVPKSARNKVHSCI